MLGSKPCKRQRCRIAVVRFLAVWRVCACATIWRSLWLPLKRIAVSALDAHMFDSGLSLDGAVFRTQASAEAYGEQVLAHGPRLLHGDPVDVPQLVLAAAGLVTESVPPSHVRNRANRLLCIVPSLDLRKLFAHHAVAGFGAAAQSPKVLVRFGCGLCASWLLGAQCCAQLAVVGRCAASVTFSARCESGSHA